MNSIYLSRDIDMSSKIVRKVVEYADDAQRAIKLYPKRLRQTMEKLAFYFVAKCLFLGLNVPNQIEYETTNTY